MFFFVIVLYWCSGLAYQVEHLAGAELVILAHPALELRVIATS